MASRAVRRGAELSGRRVSRRQTKQRQNRRVLVTASPFRRHLARRALRQQQLHHLGIGVIVRHRKDQRRGVADILGLDLGARFEQRLDCLVLAWPEAICRAVIRPSPMGPFFTTSGVSAHLALTAAPCSSSSLTTAALRSPFPAALISAVKPPPSAMFTSRPWRAAFGPLRCCWKPPPAPERSCRPCRGRPPRRPSRSGAGPPRSRRRMRRR